MHSPASSFDKDPYEVSHQSLMGVWDNTMGKTHLCKLPYLMNFRKFMLSPKSRFSFTALYGIVFNQAQLTHYGPRLQKASLPNELLQDQSSS